MHPFLRARAAALLAALVAVLAAGCGHPHHAPAPAEPAVHELANGKKLALSAGEQRTIDNLAHEAQAEDGLRDVVAPPTAAVRANADLTPPVQRGPPIPALTGASPSQPGCTTATVQNRSSRNGAPVLLFVWHWTGSQPGSGEAIVSYFDQARSQASSTWVLDRPGRCWLTVPVLEKPWTQISFNPWSVSVEVVNPGTWSYPFGLFTDKAEFDKAVRLARWAHHALGIPYQRAQVSCSPLRVIKPGFIDHLSLGSCGGGHPDVGGYDYMIVVRAAQRLDAHRPITRHDRRVCRRVKAYRDRRRRHLEPTRRGTRRFHERVAHERARGHRCIDGSPRQR